MTEALDAERCLRSSSWDPPLIFDLYLRESPSRAALLDTSGLRAASLFVGWVSGRQLSNEEGPQKHDRHLVLLPCVSIPRYLTLSLEHASNSCSGQAHTIRFTGGRFLVTVRPTSSTAVCAIDRKSSQVLQPEAFSVLQILLIQTNPN
jgi:hypothetical protein